MGGFFSIIFITIIVGKLPRELRKKGRLIGLSLAMLTRIMLLLSLVWLMKLTTLIFVMILAGFALTGESLDPDFEFKIPKGCIYFAMAFSFIVEMVNIRMRKKATRWLNYIKTSDKH